MDFFLEVHELSDLQFHECLWGSGCGVGAREHGEQVTMLAKPRRSEWGKCRRGAEADGVGGNPLALSARLGMRHLDDHAARRHVRVMENVTCVVHRAAGQSPAEQFAKLCLAMLAGPCAHRVIHFL